MVGTPLYLSVAYVMQELQPCAGDEIICRLEEKGYHEVDAVIMVNTFINLGCILSDGSGKLKLSEDWRDCYLDYYMKNLD